MEPNNYQEWAAKIEAKRNLNTATVRTTVNMLVLTAIVSVVARYTGWEVKVEDLLPYLPALAPVAAVFYRLSRYLTGRFPVLGWILFGSGKEPEYK